MADITFRTKIRQTSEGRDYIDVPQFKRNYCDMAAFRDHPKYHGSANSDLFPNALKRVRRTVIGSEYREWTYVDALPANVVVDRSGFLAEITVDV